MSALVDLRNSNEHLCTIDTAVSTLIKYTVCKSTTFYHFQIIGKASL